jgi:hypothetical protein
MRTHRKDGLERSGGCPLWGKGWQTGAMRQSSQALLVQFSAGRILLHLLCLCRDHELHWHWLGIRRELIKAHTGTVAH